MVILSEDQLPRIFFIWNVIFFQNECCIVFFTNITENENCAFFVQGRQLVFSSLFAVSC